jgi:hypothetical protein
LVGVAITVSAFGIPPGGRTYVARAFKPWVGLYPVAPPPGGRTRPPFKYLVHIKLDPARSRKIEEVGLEDLSLMPLNWA